MKVLKYLIHHYTLRPAMLWLRENFGSEPDAEAWLTWRICSGQVLPF